MYRPSYYGLWLPDINKDWLVDFFHIFNTSVHAGAKINQYSETMPCRVGGGAIAAWSKLIALSGDMLALAAAAAAAAPV